MGAKDIEKHQFKKGQSGNMKGRPKKTYAQHIQDIKDKGYKAPGKSEYFEMVSMLLSMDEDDLNAFRNNKTRPYWIRLIIEGLRDKNQRHKIMESYRDWLFGRAEQQQTVVGSGGGDITIRIEPKQSDE